MQGGSDDEASSRPTTPHLSTPVQRSNSNGSGGGPQHPFDTLVYNREDGTHAIHGEEAL